MGTQRQNQDSEFYDTCFPLPTNYILQNSNDKVFEIDQTYTFYEIGKRKHLKISLKNEP